MGIGRRDCSGNVGSRPGIRRFETKRLRSRSRARERDAAARRNHFRRGATATIADGLVVSRAGDKVLGRSAARQRALPPLQMIGSFTDMIVTNRVEFYRMKSVSP
jgi:hypothetical protein